MAAARAPLIPAMCVVAGALAACHDRPPCPSPGPPLEVVPPPSTAGALLESVAQRATRVGASPLVVVAEGVAAEGDRVGGFASLPKDKCVLVFARGSRGVGDLDLFGYSDDGSAIATDESASADAAFLLCPPMPGRVFLSARVASGAGLVALGAQEVSVEAAPAAASAIGARGRGEESGRLESWPGLETKIVAHRRAVGSSWEDVRRFAASIDPAAATRTTIAIEAGRCLDVLVVPSEEVPSVELVAETDDGRVVARAAAEGRDRWMVLCSEAGDSVTLAARPRGGSGLAAFVFGRSPKGGVSEIADGTRIDRVTQSRTSEAARGELAREIDGAWGKATAAGGGEAKIGSRTSLDIKLPAGCGRIDVVAGKPLGPLDAALWSDTGKLLAESAGATRATLYACGSNRSARLDVESSGKPGPFVVDTRAWKDVPPELAKRPLAMARLLDRVIGTHGDAPSVVADARPVDLVEQTLHASNFVVAASTCTEVVVALEAGSGIDLRLVDETTSEDVLARGRYVTSQRLCGGKTSRRSKLEVRVDAGGAGSAPGAAPALILLRSTPD